MHTWDHKLVWNVADVVLKNFYSEKNESKKQKEQQDAYAYFG